MSDNTLIPTYQLERVVTDPFLSAELGMLAKRGEISVAIMKDRAGDLRALDRETVQRLIDNETITLRPKDDTLAWEFVGGFDTFMDTYRLRPKA